MILISLFIGITIVCFLYLMEVKRRIKVEEDQHYSSYLNKLEAEGKVYVLLSLLGTLSSILLEVYT